MTQITQTTMTGLRKGRRSFLRRSLALHEAMIGYAFLLPFLIGIAIFRFYGFGYNIWLSFMDAGAFGRPRFTGFDNYLRLLTDDVLWLSVWNTLKFAVITIPGVVVVSLGVALLMQYRFRGEAVFRAIIFLPAVCLPAAMILAFAWIFQTQYGLMNAALQALGAQRVSWFGSPEGVTAVVSIVVVYLSFSIPTIILYAGLQDITPDLYEAAELDGASAWSRFLTITLPLLTPALSFVVITTAISVLKLFDVVYVLVPPSGQAVSLDHAFTMVYYYYFSGFLAIGQRGYAAAISILLLIIIMAISLVLLRIQRAIVHYGEDG